MPLLLVQGKPSMYSLSNLRFMSILFFFSSYSHTGLGCFEKHLIENKTLTHLDVSKNKITKIGACSLGQCLSKSNTLVILNVGDNDLTSDGANHSGLEELSSGMPSTLVRFHCANARIYSDGAKRL